MNDSKHATVLFVLLPQPLAIPSLGQSHGMGSIVSSTSCRLII